MPELPGRIKAKRLAPPSITDQRKAAARRIRSSQSWRIARMACLSETPLCQNPRGLHDGRIVPATQVHHIQRLELRPDLAFTASNLMAVCSECHGVLSAEERSQECAS